jgi:transposase
MAPAWMIIGLPQGQAARQALATLIGAAGRTVLTALCAADAPDWLRQLPAVETLRQTWLQQYEAVADSEPMRWRAQTDQPPAAQHINSPYDPEARYGNKRTTHGWATRRTSRKPATKMRRI